MPDDDDPLAVACTGDVVQEAADALDDLAIALSARERLVDVRRALGLELRDRHPVQRAVVALPKPRVPVDRDAGPREGDLGGLDRAGEIGGEDRGEVVVAPASAQLLREPLARLGETTLKPAGGDP